MNEGTVFVVEQGSYSDYRVVGVFSTRENAQMIADKINAGQSYEEASVDEWPLDPGVDAINKGLQPWTVHMLRDGTTEHVKKVEYGPYDSLTNEIREWERELSPAYKGKGVPNCLTATVWAEDEKHAIKIVNEHRIQRLALGQWKGKL